MTARKFTKKCAPLVFVLLIKPLAFWVFLLLSSWFLKVTVTSTTKRDNFIEKPAINKKENWCPEDSNIFTSQTEDRYGVFPSIQFIGKRLQAAWPWKSILERTKVKYTVYS